MLLTDAYSEISDTLPTATGSRLCEDCSLGAVELHRSGLPGDIFNLLDRSAFTINGGRSPNSQCLKDSSSKMPLKAKRCSLCRYHLTYRAFTKPWGICRASLNAVEHLRACKVRSKHKHDCVLASEGVPHSSYALSYGWPCSCIGLYRHSFDFRAGRMRACRPPAGGGS